MNPNELKKEIWELYRQSRVIYGNKQYVFGNQTPLYPDFDHAVDYIKEAHPDLYKKLQQSLYKDQQTGKIQINWDIADTLVKDFSVVATTDFSSMFQIVITIFTIIWNSLLLYRQQDTGNKHFDSKDD